MIENKKNFKYISKKGALTSYSYSFTSRPWELRSIETIDLFDSNCSNIRIDTRGSKIMRILPRINENINEQWISDKTRFAYDSLYKWRFVNPMIKAQNKFVDSNWKNAINIYLEKLNEGELILFNGPFSSLETIICSKYFFNKKGFNTFFSENNINSKKNDWRCFYSVNNKNISKSNILMLIGSNLRLENPILNLKIRKLTLTKPNYYVFSINGYYLNNFQIKNLSNNISTLFNILKGKHFFCTFLCNLQKKIYKRSFFPKISFILGNNLQLRKDFDDIMLSIKNSFFVNFFNRSFEGLNVNILDAGSINAFELNSINYKNIKRKQKEEYIAIFQGKSFIKKKYDYNIYQGHQNDQLFLDMDLILPTSNWTEKKENYLNNNLINQNTNYLSKSVVNSREDWKIMKVLQDITFLNKNNLENNIIKSNKDINNLLLKTTKLIYSKKNEYNISMNNNYIRYNYYNSSILNHYHTLFINDYMSRNSKIMLLCYNQLKKKYNNYNIL